MNRGQKAPVVMRRSMRSWRLTIVIGLVTGMGVSCMKGVGSGGPGVRKPVEGPIDEYVANENPNAHYVGQLPRPLSDYATHGDEFYKQFGHKPWHGFYRDRNCAECPQTSMKIQAMGNTHKDGLTNLPVYGVVWGRVSNVGPYDDASTKFKAAPPGAIPDEYYYVITDDGSRTAATLSVVKIEFSALETPKNDITIYKAGKLTKCTIEHSPWGESTKGDFHMCPPKRAESLYAMPWFSCDGGCCTSDWTAPQ